MYQTLRFIEIDHRLCTVLVFFHTDFQLFNCIILALYQLTSADITDPFNLARLIDRVIDRTALRADPAAGDSLHQFIETDFQSDD